MINPWGYLFISLSCVLVFGQDTAKKKKITPHKKTQTNRKGQPGLANSNSNSTSPLH